MPYDPEKEHAKRVGNIISAANVERFVIASTAVIKELGSDNPNLEKIRKNMDTVIHLRGPDGIFDEIHLTEESINKALIENRNRPAAKAAIDVVIEKATPNYKRLQLPAPRPKTAASTNPAPGTAKPSEEQLTLSRSKIIKELTTKTEPNANFINAHMDILISAHKIGEVSDAYFIRDPALASAKYPEGMSVADAMAAISKQGKEASPQVQAVLKEMHEYMHLLVQEDNKVIEAENIKAHGEGWREQLERQREHKAQRSTSAK